MDDIETLRLENEMLKIENSALWSIINTMGQAVAKMEQVFVEIEIIKQTKFKGKSR